VATKRRKKHSPLISLAIFAIAAIVVAVPGAVGISRAFNGQLEDVSRDATLTASLAEPSPDFENYLLVGSDSREGADPNDADYANVGDAADIGGRRSDSMMVLHREVASGAVSLMSIPRDLWVEIGDGTDKQRINTAYQLGPDVLLRTVQRALGIPIHHYVEINFQGFKTIVDAVGGVSICVQHQSRDKHTGLFMRRGCNILDGVEGLAYARSRFFEQKIDGEWQVDGSSDIGRTARQREFVQALVKSAVVGLVDNPFRAGDVMRGGISAVTVDERLDLLEFAKRMRPAATTGIASMHLETYGAMAGESEVLKLAEDAAPLLAYFAGTGPRPEPSS
jgi:LCP family protein required for cell wall assembly